MQNIYFDTETSGLRPGQIGQLALIIEDSSNNITGKNYFFKIKSIEPGAAEVTHRDTAFYEKASNGKVFADYAEEISNLLKDSRLIAHNLPFDENFLSMEFFRCDIPFSIAERFDTMKFFTDIMKLPGKYGNSYKSPKLIELTKYLNLNDDKVADYTKELFGLDSSNFHDAMFDTTSMFAACKVFNDIQFGTRSWIERFT